MTTNKIKNWSDWETLPLGGQFNETIRSNLPLESGLRALAEQTSSRRTRKVLTELSEKLERGVPLVEAVRDVNCRLPRTMSALVEAGIEAGRLDTVMQYSVEQTQRASSLRHEIWMAMVYPLFLIWFSVSICMYILSSIIPYFKKIFDDFGTELPEVTVALIQLSDAVQFVGWLPFSLIIPGLIVAAGLIYGSGLLAVIERRISMVPLFGTVFRLASISEFCNLMAILLESNLPFPHALRFAAQASDDNWISRKCQKIAAELENGASADAAATLAELPNSLSQVFRHVSAGKTATEALRGLGELYASRCTVGCRLLSSILEPISVVFVMGFAVLTALAVFLPLIKLLNDLS